MIPAPLQGRQVLNNRYAFQGHWLLHTPPHPTSRQSYRSFSHFRSHLLGTRANYGSQIPINTSLSPNLVDPLHNERRASRGHWSPRKSGRLLHRRSCYERTHSSRSTIFGAFQSPATEPTEPYLRERAKALVNICN